ncbi:MAG TPA: hypothetical protein VM452_16285 [Caulifigura sp.]|nr:hypothetical protein [Caulifigura sp.]
MGLKRNNRRSVQSVLPSAAEKSNRHSRPEDSAGKGGRRLLDAVLVAVAAVGLSWFFFPKLWTGGGLIGGDTYSYYFPQKVTYQEALRAGRLPHWNEVVSLGYPQLAESQTGALAPINLVLYRLFDVNTAYNAVHLLHYIAAYVFAWLLARRFGIRATGAHLAALTFVYGWFPPRACLEWAIIGGAFFPLIAWCVESYLQSGRLRWLAIASVALGSFLMTGHFNLAFISLLLCTLLVLLRLTWASDGLAEAVKSARVAAGCRVAAAIALGFGIAAPQLLPSAELKSVSQREDGGFNQTYGRIPVWYLTQPLWPTLWYAPDLNPDESLSRENSNRIEANLYFGVVPFYLAAGGLLALWATGASWDRRLTILAIAGLGSVVLATGVLMPVLRWVPGFGYFAGPGRYGMLTTLAVAFAAGHVLDRVLTGRRLRPFWFLIAAAAFVVTTLDLSYVHNCVTYLTFVDHAPIDLHSESPVGEFLKRSKAPVRVLAPGPNLPSMMGVNCVPEYLGIGPRQYYDKRLAIPRFSKEQEKEDPELVPSLVRWTQQAGVTHVLAQEPLDTMAWPVESSASTFDPFLNSAWGRGRDPLYLYALKGSRARAFLEGRPDGSGVTVTQHSPEHLTLDIENAADGRLVLLELMYPGWETTIDGQPARAELFEEVYRSVQVPAGKHVVEWRFVSRSFSVGLMVSGVSLVVLGAWLGMGRWRRRATAGD